MNPRRSRRLLLLCALLTLLAASLACTESNMRVADIPVWECPTAIPLPTDTQAPTATVLPGTPTSTPAATLTPWPTATPYVLTSDFPLGRYVKIGSLGLLDFIGIRVMMDNVEVDGPFEIANQLSAETGNLAWVASWDVTVENGSLNRIYEVYPQFQLYAIETFLPDGRTLRGAWGLSAEAADLIDLPSLELTEEATTLQPQQNKTYRVAAFIPGDDVWRLAYILDPLDTEDVDEMVANNSIGSNVLVIINSYDTTCLNEEGPPGTGTPPAGGTFKLTGHPVSPVSIIRGFGCSPFFTGELSSGCPATEPWLHNGVDYGVPRGTAYQDTLPLAGAVQFAGENTGGPDCSDWGTNDPPYFGYGNYVKHTTTTTSGGDTLEVALWGAHLSSFGVDSGDPTAPGQVLGLTGNTGCSTGPHLHFTVKMKINGGSWQYVDPLTIIP